LDAAATLSEGRSATELASQYILKGLLKAFGAGSVSDAVDIAVAKLESKKSKDPTARLRSLLPSAGSTDQELASHSEG